MTVKQIQCLLVFLGFDPGPLDGLAGPRTQSALAAFQKKINGLNATGQSDDGTLKALRHAVACGMPGSGSWWDEIAFFRPEEFACKCSQYHAPYCNGYPAQMREDVVRLCEGARRYFGHPGHVVSGLRCPRHNADTGGVENSQHMYGEAVDLMIEGISGQTLLDYFLAQPGVRYAYVIQGGSSVHVDVSKGAR